MEISVKMDVDDFVELLLKRLKEFWTSDCATIKAFGKMYRNNAESGVFEGLNITKLGIMEIVDNDWVNYIRVIEKDDISESQWQALKKLQNGDLSECEYPLGLDCGNSGYLEVITDEVALIRH